MKFIAIAAAFAVAGTSLVATRVVRVTWLAPRAIDRMAAAITRVNCALPPVRMENVLLRMRPSPKPVVNASASHLHSFQQTALH
jgi:hypothetical protein